MKKLDVIPAPQSVRHSAQAAVAASTPFGPQSSPETAQVLTILLCSLLSQTLSPDIVFLACGDAAERVREAGISNEEFERVTRIVYAYWQQEWKRNPMHKMFA